MTIVLDEDRFSVDDRLPLIHPQPKRLSIATWVDPGIRDFVMRFTNSLQRIDYVRRSENPDMEILSYVPGVIPAITANAICFPRNVPPPRNDLDRSGLIVANTDPLTEGLTWHGLLCRPLLGVKPTATDRVLVW